MREPARVRRFDDGVGGGCRLHRAGAAGVGAGGVGAVRQVGDLARRAVRAAEEPAAHQEPHPDPGADGQADQHVHAERGAQRVLADRAQVGVVLDEHVRAVLGQRLLEFAQQATALPAGQVRRAVHRACRRIRDAGCADHGGNDVIGRQTRGSHGARNRFPYGPDECARRTAAVRFVQAGDDAAVQIGHRDPDRAPSDVDTDNMPGIRCGLIHHRRAAWPGKAAAGRADQAVALQIEQRLAHRRLGKPGVGGNLWSRGFAVFTEPFQHQALVQRPHVRRGSGLWPVLPHTSS